MELTPLRSSTGCGACCGYEFGALFLVGPQMTVLVFLSTSAPADIISTELGNGLALTKYSFTQLHVDAYSRTLLGNQDYFWIEFVAVEDLLSNSTARQKGIKWF